MIRTLQRLTGVLAVLAAPLASQAAPVFALAQDGSVLVRFDSANPASVSTIGALNGATTQLNGLDFRPADGFLYGYQAAGSGIYRVDPQTGETTLVSTSSAPVAATVLGIDFNPVPDRLRVVTDQGDNRRINVATGAAITDGGLTFAAGDANAGATPRVADVAYTNADTNAATGTQLYYIDWVLDLLLTTSNPNGGVVTTVGSLGLDTDANVGFDILTDAGGTNTALASFSVAGVSALYRIDLGSGAATWIGDIGAGPLIGLAVAAVPEPASLGLAAVGLLALTGLPGRAASRRRRPAAVLQAASSSTASS